MGSETIQEDSDLNTYSLACDYIKFKLMKSGYNWETCPPLPMPSTLRLCLRSLAEDLEEDYRSTFGAMTEDLNMISASSAKATFFGVTEELFFEGITWSRIVALFAFGGVLCQKCVSQGAPQLVDQVPYWIKMYVDTRLSSWMAENGGWNGFMAHFGKILSIDVTRTWRFDYIHKLLFSFGTVCAAVALSLMLIHHRCERQS
uniref:Bcl-2 Bcl-2 homology region 1-3 domain-containing protein n=1 Tax=Romanomermis culicivorax TaxID=13658 RepID=A0A915HEJ9_ROMCU